MTRPLRWLVPAALLVTITFSCLSYAQVDRPVRITELYLAPPGSIVGNQKVELTNLGPAPVDIGGWCLRSQNKDAQFPVGTMLMPSETYVIHIGGTGANDADNFNTGRRFSSLRPFWGSLELHQDLPGMPSAETLVDYVNWGGPHHPNAAMADSVGLWKHGEYLPAHNAPGFSYQFCDRIKDSAAAWDTKAADVGVLNVCLHVPTPVQATTWGKVKARFSN